MHNRISLFICLLALVGLLFSCGGSVKSNPAKANENGLDSKALEQGSHPDSAAQIGEYVVSVFEDSKGNLWFGTMAFGAACYDGKALTYLNETNGLLSNTVVNMAEDRAGNLWFGSHDGATRYNPSVGEGASAFDYFAKKEGLSGAGCHILVDRKGDIWAATNHGVFQFSGKVFKPFPIPNPEGEFPDFKWEKGKIWTYMEDSKGNMWFARDGYGACKYDGKSFTHFTRKDGLCSNIVSGLQEDHAGNIWIGCLSSDFPEYVSEGGLCRYDGKSIQQFPDVKGLHDNDIYLIYCDQSGSIWIGAVGVGAYRFRDGNFTLFDQTTRPDLTARFGLQSMLQDRNGTLWCGFSGGLFKFDGTIFQNVTRSGPWR